MEEGLLGKFQARTAQVAVIGLGYVGLPLALNFAKAGYRVVGIDLDRRKVEAINRGESYIGDISNEELARYVAAPAPVATPPAGQALAYAGAMAQPAVTTTILPAGALGGGSLTATTDYAVLAACDAVSICVPTPLSKTGDPDISFIVAATEEIVRYLHPGMVIVLESTTYPGTTREVVLPLLDGGSRDKGVGSREKEVKEAAPLVVGHDFFLAFSPERIDPGRHDWLVHNTPKVIGGVTPACAAMAAAYYGQAIEQVVPVSSPDAAEMVKLFENTFRMVNVGLANELLLMCDKLGLDAWEVLAAAATKPFGFMQFTPGPGLGGHCIPIDPQYLSWKLRTLAYNARFIALANEVNTEMPRYWVQQVQDRLNMAGRALKGSRILVLGVAYKKNVSDLRESPALDIIHLLEAKGAQVYYHDPHIPYFQHEGMEMVRVSDLEVALRMVDCVVIATDHDAYDWSRIARCAAVLVDTRHVARGA